MICSHLIALKMLHLVCLPIPFPFHFLSPIKTLCQHICIYVMWIWILHASQMQIKTFAYHCIWNASVFTFFAIVCLQLQKNVHQTVLEYLQGLRDLWNDARFEFIWKFQFKLNRSFNEINLMFEVNMDQISVHHPFYDILRFKVFST